MPEKGTSLAWLFADDTMLGKTVTSQHDHERLRQGLRNLGGRENEWEMSFYPDKFNTVPVTGGKKTMPHSYSLRGHQLETVNTTKYLEVMIQKDAGKDKHINIMCRKVSRALSCFAKKPQDRRN